MPLIVPSASSLPFKPALLVIDVQNDFLPPSGSLAVPRGTEVIPVINSLLRLPFALKIASQDWHPPGHVSFASSHGEGVKPLEDTYLLTSLDGKQSMDSLTWPDHCIQHSVGAQLASDLDVDAIDEIVQKGVDKQMEMYSAFCDPFGTSVTALPTLLAQNGITDVYVVGLATDHCVRCSAIDATKFGFRTWIIEDAVRAVSRGEAALEEMKQQGVGIVQIDGEQLERVEAIER